jgi:hypothetical protein
MSREDDRCLLADCRVARLHHADYLPSKAHVFIEPPRAKAPQGETGMQVPIYEDGNHMDGPAVALARKNPAAINRTSPDTTTCELCMENDVDKPAAFQCSGCAEYSCVEHSAAHKCLTSKPAAQPETLGSHPPVRCDRCIAKGYGRCDHPKAAQPETGGDEAIANELLRRWDDRVANGGNWPNFWRAIKEGIAAGRAAENEACEKQLKEKHAKLDAQLKRWESDGKNHGATLHYLTGEVCALFEAIDAIAARRGRTG